VETSPHISPDGRTVAFTGQYEGFSNIYTIPIEGGEPKRLTYDTLPDVCLGWTPDGKIAYGTLSGNFIERQQKLWYIDPNGGLPQATKIDEVSNLSFFPDGKTIAYNRQNAYAFNWRHYRGGSQGKISFYNFPDNKYWELPAKREQSYWPLVVGKDLFYLTDRGTGVVNLYRYDLESKEDHQLTHYDDEDIRTPSTDGKNIVFERDGLLYDYNIGSGQVDKIETRILSEDLSARPMLRNVANQISDFDISPTGVRIAVEARGNIFSVPAKHGDTRNFTNLSGSRARYPRWSHDGQTIAYISDQTGNYELYTQPQLGGTPTQLTHDTSGTIERIDWSSTGKYIDMFKTDNSVWIIDVATKKLTKVIQPPYSLSGESEYYPWLAWSPDDRWLAFDQGVPNGLSQVVLYNVESGKTTAVDSGQYDDESLAFDQNGKYLYFVSSRTFVPSNGIYEFSLKVENSQRIYVVPLAKDTPDPLTVQSDEEPETTASTPSPKPQPAAPKGKDDGKPETKVDFDGISSRILPLPMPAGNYTIPFGADGGVFYVSDSTLSKFNFESRESESILAGLAGGHLAINPSQSKIAYDSAGTLGVIDVHPGNPPGTGRVDTSNVEEVIDPRQEWKQIYWEAWRYERDHYYDPNMRGLNWDAIGHHYSEYLKWVNNRNDLNYVLGSLIGELGTSHSYVFGGDMGTGNRPIPIGMLGADYATDGDHIKFAKIYRGHNYDENVRGPLAEPGVVVHEGDYLLDIDGQPVTSHTNPNSLLLDKVEKYVTLTVNSTPTEAGARKVRVRPIGNDLDLRYFDFVDRTAQKVSDMSNGRIGYMHIRDTQEQGAIDFIRGFYPQTDKDAVIVDERWNEGGYVQPWFVDTLGRTMYAYWKSRDLAPNPIEPAILGPKCMLINGYAGSGGDFFPYMFRYAKLGPLIGERTWGGLVGISENINLVDGGLITAPSAAIFDPKTDEIVAENHGIDPDIEVDRRPDQVANGEDAQIEAAVKYLLDQLAKHPPVKVPNSIPRVSPLGQIGK
jgi:tricorn protease